MKCKSEMKTGQINDYKIQIKHNKWKHYQNTRPKLNNKCF